MSGPQLFLQIVALTLHGRPESSIEDCYAVLLFEKREQALHGLGSTESRLFFTFIAATTAKIAVHAVGCHGNHESCLYLRV